MSRVSDTREALIAEALGDFAKVLDRIDAVTPTLKEARDELEFTAARLLGNIEPFQTRIVTRAIETQEQAVAHIVQQANLVARKTVDEQTRAMQEAARRIFNDEVVPPLHRVASELRQAHQRVRPSWEGWLTHATVAVTAASCTWMLMVYLAPVSAAEAKAVSNAPSPGCAQPAVRPETSRVRR
jgi:putative lipoic acid-binding regulatory protein